MAEKLVDALLELKTDSRAFDKGIGKAEKKTRKLDKGFGKANKSAKLLKSSLLAIGGALVVGTGIAVAMKKVANLGDQIAKMSTRVNISVERLSAYRLVTELAGSSLAVFAKSQQTLARSIVDADRGLETYKRVFDELGITLRDSNGQLKSTEQVFFEMSDAVKELGVSTKTTATLQEVLGRGGKELANVMINGSQAIKEQMKEAERLGAVWTELESKQAEDFNDALTRLKFGFQGITKEIFTAIEPAFTKLIDWFTNLTVKVRSVKTALSGLDPELKKHLSNLASLALDLAKVTALVVGMTAALLITAKAMAILAKSMMLAHGAMLLFNAHPIILGFTLLTAAVIIAAKKIDFVAEKLDGLMRSVGAAPLIDMWNDIEKGVTAAEAAIGELSVALKKQGSTFDALAKSGTTYNAVLEKGQQILVSLRTPQEVFNNQLRALQNMLAVDTIGWETYTRAVKAAQKELAATRPEIKLVSRVFDEASSTMEDSILGLIRGTQSLSEGFRNMVDSILESLQRMFIQELILAPIKAGILSALTSRLGGASLSAPAQGKQAASLLGSVITPHTGGVIGKDDFRFPKINVPSTVFANAPRFHAGGLAGDDIPAVVRRGEGVFTPAQMKALGGPVSIVINNNTGAPVKTRESRSAQGGRSIEVIIGDIVSKDIHDGGRIHQAIGRTFGAGVRPQGR